MSKLKEIATLLAALVAIAASVIAVVRFFSAPDPFSVRFHMETVQLPEAVSATGSGAVLNGPTQLMAITIQNHGVVARHNVAVRIQHIESFRGAGVASTPPAVIASSTWRKPTFNKVEQTLEFARLTELPVNAEIQVWIWGQLDEVFSMIDVQSSEGTASEGQDSLAPSWQSFWFSQLWWIAALSCLGIAIVALRSYEKRKGSPKP